MRIHLINLSKKLFIAGTVSMLAFGCGNEQGNSDNDKKPHDTLGPVVQVGGKVFCIPSPVQTAQLIKKIGAPYDNKMLNSPKNATSYSTKFQRALNLGIYGADLGYSTLYDQQDEALTYFNSVNSLANELGLSGAFDKVLIDRFKANLTKKDSILSLVSTAYRASDAFLKKNDRNEEGALIIAGGWIETLHFVTSVEKQKDNEEIKRRIAEQKNTLENLLALLSKYQGNEEYSELLKNLRDLKSDFDNVQMKYTYVKPETDEASKTTTITSKTEYTITPEQIQSITNKIASIRSLIVT